MSDFNLTPLLTSQPVRSSLSSENKISVMDFDDDDNKKKLKIGVSKEKWGGG